MNSTVAAVESFRFLGTTISQDLKWDNHVDSIVKKAQQRLYFLRQLRKFNLPQELLKQFYSAILEYVLCSSITVWFGSAQCSNYTVDFGGAHFFNFFLITGGGLCAYNDLRRYITATSVCTTCFMQALYRINHYTGFTLLYFIDTN